MLVNEIISMRSEAALHSAIFPAQLCSTADLPPALCRASISSAPASAPAPGPACCHPCRPWTPPLGCPAKALHTLGDRRSCFLDQSQIGPCHCSLFCASLAMQCKFHRATCLPHSPPKLLPLWLCRAKPDQALLTALRPGFKGHVTPPNMGLSTKQ